MATDNKGMRPMDDPMQDDTTGMSGGDMGNDATRGDATGQQDMEDMDADRTQLRDSE